MLTRSTWRISGDTLGHRGDVWANARRRLGRFPHPDRDLETDHILTVKTRVGVATLIQLDDSESLNVNGLIGMGDAEAWKVSVKGHHILLKPTAAWPDTNLTILI